MTRLSSSSEEAVLDISLDGPSKELVSSSAQAVLPIAQQEPRVMTKWTVMSKGKETTAVMTLLGDVLPLSEQRRTEDRPISVREDVQDDHETEVNYDGDSSEEANEPASRAVILAGEHQTLGVEPTTAIVQELSSRPDEENAETKDKGNDNASDSGLSLASDLIPAAATAKPVLNAKDIMSIVERKDISIKKPGPNHNPQRQGLEDNLFDFGDALCDYTSDDTVAPLGSTKGWQLLC
jgi:hypothetical protein